MSKDIDLSFFENEDAIRSFQLRRGSATDSTALDLSGVEFLSEVRDAKNALVLRLTSDEGDGGIVIDDAPNGKFSLHFGRGAIPYQANRSLKFDLLMVVSGETARLFGGSIRVSPGVTQNE